MTTHGERPTVDGENRQRTRRTVALHAGALLVMIALFATVVLRPVPRPSSVPTAGVQDIPISSSQHVAVDVQYPTVPPVGGDHAAVWQDCGFYEEPVPEEAAVHSLEHGAVWLAYDPGAGPDARAALAELTVNEPYLLVSPVDGMETALAAAAWGRLLPLDGPDAPMLEDFLREHLQGPQTPEPGAPCTGGLAIPAP